MCAARLYIREAVLPVTVRLYACSSSQSAACLCTWIDSLRWCWIMICCIYDIFCCCCCCRRCRFVLAVVAAVALLALFCHIFLIFRFCCVFRFSRRSYTENYELVLLLAEKRTEKNDYLKCARRRQNFFLAIQIQRVFSLLVTFWRNYVYEKFLSLFIFGINILLFLSSAFMCHQKVLCEW